MKDILRSSELIKGHTFMPDVFRRNHPQQESVRKPDTMTAEQKLELIHKNFELHRAEGLERSDENVLKTVAFLKDIGRPFYIAGGVGLELQTEGMKRMHSDIDVEMFEEDWPVVREYMQQHGYKRQFKGEDPGDSLGKEYRDAGFYKGRQELDGPDGKIEIFFMRRDGVDPAIVHSALYDMPLPLSLYDNSTLDVSGVEVPVVPRQILMLYKMYFAKSSQINDRRDLEAMQKVMSPKELGAIDDLFARTRIYAPGSAIHQFQINKNLLAQYPNVPFSS